MGAFVYARAIKNHKICIKRIGKKAIATEAEQQANLMEMNMKMELEMKTENEAIKCRRWQSSGNCRWANQGIQWVVNQVQIRGFPVKSWM